MLTYRYRAVDALGKVQQGRQQAVSEAALAAQLSALGQALISARPVAHWAWQRRCPAQELITFFVNLELLLRAGVPLLDALLDLRDSSGDPGLRAAVGGMLLTIQNGQTLSQAMRAYPMLFSPTLCSLVHAGEVSGQLPEVLSSMIRLLKWQDEMRAQTKTALLYPLLVAGVIVAVLIFLLLYLVPQLAAFMHSLGQEPPWQTRVLLGLSAGLQQYGWFLLALLLLLPALLWPAWRRNVVVQHWLDQQVLRLWGIGSIWQKILLARLSHTFALLYRAGISVLDCLALLPSVLGNRRLAAGVQQVAREIEGGVPLALGFERTGLFPPLVIRMLKIGETTGALDEALLNVSYFYEREARQAVQRFQTMLEPLMTLLLGAVLGWVMLAVLSPVYQLVARLGML